MRASVGIEVTDPGGGPLGTGIGFPGPRAYYDDYVVVPIRVGLQRYVHGDNSFVYAEPGIGIGFFPWDDSGETGRRVSFSYAVGGGYRFYLNDRKYLQASLAYNYNPYGERFKFSWVYLRAAYGLTWGRGD